MSSHHWPERSENFWWDFCFCIFMIQVAIMYSLSHERREYIYQFSIIGVKSQFPKPLKQTFPSKILTVPFCTYCNS